MTLNANYSGGSNSSTTITYGGSLNLPTPTRSGYTFDGWYTAASGGTLVTSGTGGKAWGPAWTGTYYAHWTASTRTVTFQDYDGTTLSTQTVNDGTAWSAVTQPTASREGYNFSAWTNAPSTVTADVTVTASYTPITYTIGYTLNGGSVATANPTSYNIETNTFTLSNPTKNGYTFNGWTGSNGSTPQTSVSIPKDSTGNKSYTANWTQIPASVTTAPTANTLTYNGAAQALVSAGTASNGTMQYRLGTSGSYSTSIPTAKDAGNYTVSYKAVGTGGYGDSAEASVTVTIGKKNITVSDITAQNKTYDGTTTAALDTSDATLTGKLDGDALTVTATGTFADANAGENKTVTISGLTLGGTSAGNYALASSGQQTSTTANITHKSVTITASSANKTYDGTALTESGFTATALETGDTHTFTVAMTENSTITDAGTQSNVIATVDGAAVTTGTPVDIGNYTVTTTDGTLTVNQRSVTLTSASASKAYDGAALTNDTVTVSGDGWASGEGAAYSVVGSQTLPGSSANTFTYTLNSGTKAENYTINKVEGTLTVTDRTDDGENKKYEITVTAKSAAVLYDGTVHMVSGFETLAFTFFNGVTYTVSGLSAEASGIDAGTYAVNVTGTATVKDPAGNDLTAQFIVNTANGTLTVSKRNVTLTSATKERQYNGAALTDDTVAVTGDGFIDGEGAAYHVTGSQKLVGSSPNSFTYTLDGGTKADNYNITTTEGTLTVTNRDAKYEISPQANSGEFKYDGTEKTVSGFVTNTFTVDGSDYTVSGLSATASGTDAGTCTVSVDGTAVVKDSDGSDVTEQFSVTPIAGTLTITKREVTLTSATDAKEYDGTALCNSGVTVGGDGFAPNEGAAYSVTGTRTLVGTSENTFTYTLNDGTKADNYAITINFGSLTVNNRNAKYAVTLSANSGVFLYDGTGKTVTGWTIGGATGGSFTAGNGLSYTVSGMSAALTMTDAGTYTVNVTGTPVVKDAGGSDVTAQFAVSVVSGTLRINKRSVTLTSATDSKTYDGAALTDDAVTVTGDGWASGEGTVYSFTGSQTLPGSSANAFTYTLDSGTKAENYTITKVEGTLTVTDRTNDGADKKYEITVRANSAAVMYDGAAHTVSGFETLAFTFNGVTYTVSGLSAAASGTNAGTYAATVTGTAAVKDPAGNDLTAQFIVNTVDGALTVNPAPLNVKADDKVMVYRFSTTVPALTYTVEGLVDGDTASSALTGALATTATTTSAAGEYAITQGTLAADNYVISFTPGRLTVRKAAQNAPASGEGYAIADGKITVKSNTNANANNETHYEASDGANTYAYGTNVSIEAGKTYRIRWAGGDNYEPSSWVSIVTEATVTASAVPVRMGKVEGLASGGRYAIGAGATLTATPSSDTLYQFVEWQDASGKQVSTSAAYTFTVTKDTKLTAIFAEKDKTVAALPTVTTGLAYTGSEQTGVTDTAEIHYTWADGSINKATNAGTYAATAKLDENCVWPDGTTADLKLTWRIDKAAQIKPTVTLTGSTITIPTDKPVEVSTDGGRTWRDAPSSINGTDGTAYQFRYQGDDNHSPSPAVIVKVNVPPTVTTIAASDLTSTGATLNGTVSATDGVSAVGFQYKKAGESAWTDTDAGNPAKTFSAALTGLTADTDYVFRAVAAHTSGTLVGREVTFRTPKATPAGTGSITATVTGGSREVIVSIEEGNDAIAATSGTTDCEITFGTLPDGFYNVVVRTADGDYTETRMIEVKDGGAATTVFAIPVGKLATVVEVKTDDTPKAAVDGLNELITAEEKDAAAAGAQDVEVKLEVEKKEETAATGSDEIKALDGNMIDTYLDMSLYKTTTELDVSGETESVETTDIGATNDTVLEIAIPYANIDKTGLKVYRYHNLIAEILTALTAKPLGGFVDGTYYLDKTGGYIFLYASGFSTYAIGYTEYTPAPYIPYIPTPMPVPAPTLDPMPAEPTDPTEEPTGDCPKDATCPISAFTDADPAAWYHDGVHWALENGVMNGVGNGSFQPDGTTTRAMIAMILWNMEDKPVVNYLLSFSDVRADFWYTEAIRWAVANGVMDGYGDGTFGPNDVLTREQLVTILYRYAKLKGVDVSVSEDTNILSYDDAFDVSEWAIPAMQWAVGSGLISGRTASTLNPQDKTTRAEIATIIMRYCEEIAK